MGDAISEYQTSAEEKAGSSSYKTVKQRIVAHLSRTSLDVYYALPYSELPRAVCQEGIAEGAGVSRAHAALELRYLMKEGVVDVKLEHVDGYKRRKKVYYLKWADERWLG